MNIDLVRKAAEKFLGGAINGDPQPIGDGLIHLTFKASGESGAGRILLQAINKHIFKKPEDIVHNYLLVYEYLKAEQGMPMIPAPVATQNGEFIWKDEKQNCWRATAFFEGTYSPMVAESREAAFAVARNFARFTSSLSGLDTHLLKEILPGFHNLSARYQQLETAISSAPMEKLLKSTHTIAEFRERKKLVDFYEFIIHSADFPDRVTHHDCKISNILFDKTTNQAICPVDLDTVMPGKFFSDLGDMIRSMSCTKDENSIQWEQIQIRQEFYESILKGYLEAMSDKLSEPEKKNIHYSGLMMIYMQGIRFLADYLNGDPYYKTNYAEQNLNRALNQLILLENLEELLKSEYNFIPY
ncbi:MAG: phosphotransferase enzyme family protein [Chitinophagales bacterium]